MVRATWALIQYYPDLMSPDCVTIGVAVTAQGYTGVRFAQDRWRRALATHDRGLRDHYARALDEAALEITERCSSGTTLDELSKEFNGSVQISTPISRQVVSPESLLNLLLIQHIHMFPGDIDALVAVPPAPPVLLSGPPPPPPYPSTLAFLWRWCWGWVAARLVRSK